MADEQTRLGTVLVVDDMPDNIDVLKGVLIEEFNVKVATSGEKALSIAQSALPDLILLDIMMPEMDGYEVCSRLKQLETTREIPVIFVTALTEVVNEEKGFQVGCVDYLTKPVSPSVALARVKTHIALRRAQQELQEWNRNLKGRVKGLSSLVTDKVQRLGSVDIDQRRIRDEWLELLLQQLNMMDPELQGHADRVAALSVEVALRSNCSSATVETIRVAALLHDLGKIGLPPEVALAAVPEKLPDILRKLYQNHAVRGQFLTSHIEGLRETGLLIRHHHEQFNGSGYPDRLIGEEIPLGARIIAIADYIDRATSHEKTGTMLFYVMKNLKNLAGRNFDQGLIPYFEEVVPSMYVKPDMNKELSEIVTLAELKPGMLMGEDLCTGSGVKIIARGEMITEEKLKQIRRAQQIDQPVLTKVLVSNRPPAC
jgi:putative two-component system response regulator